MAFKAINNTTRLDRLVPTLLVYGAYPRITKYDPPSLSVVQRALAIKKAMAEVQKLRAKRQINNALNIRNGPSTYDVNSLNINNDMLVQREGNTSQPGSWRGLYKLISINQELYVLALPHGNTTFRSTFIKPYLIPTN